MKNSTNELISSLFNPQKIPEEAISILENFDKIVQDNLPLNSKQLSKLPEDIRELMGEAFNESEKKKEEDNENFFNIMKKYHYDWWS